MSEQALQPSPASEGTPEFIPTTEISVGKDAPEAVNSVSAAAKLLRSARHANRQPEEQAAEAPPSEPPADTPSPDDGDAAPAEGPGATEEVADPALQEPSIDAPRSWSKEEKELFKSLPRDLQQTLAEREKGRESDFLRRQNEVTEKTKASEAERQRLEQLRTQYESALPTLLQSLHQNPEFADIKTMQDVERMANEDWPRFARWQFQQSKIAAVEAELKTAQARQESEARTQWEHFAKRQDELFLEKAPEMQDATKRTKTVEAAQKLLADKGYTQDELGRLWNNPVFRDARMQQLILDAVRFQDAKQAALQATKKPLPPVQRPGVANPGKDRDEIIKGLEAKLANASGVRNQLMAAAALRAARAKK